MLVSPVLVHLLYISSRQTRLSGSAHPRFTEGMRGHHTKEGLLWVSPGRSSSSIPLAGRRQQTLQSGSRILLRKHACVTGFPVPSSMTYSQHGFKTLHRKLSAVSHLLFRPRVRKPRLGDLTCYKGISVLITKTEICSKYDQFQNERKITYVVDVDHNIFLQVVKY